MTWEFKQNKNNIYNLSMMCSFQHDLFFENYCVNYRLLVAAHIQNWCSEFKLFKNVFIIISGSNTYVTRVNETDCGISEFAVYAN